MGFPSKKHIETRASRLNNRTQFAEIKGNFQNKEAFDTLAGTLDQDVQTVEFLAVNFFPDTHKFERFVDGNYTVDQFGLDRAYAINLYDLGGVLANKPKLDALALHGCSLGSAETAVGLNRILEITHIKDLDLRNNHFNTAKAIRALKLGSIKVLDLGNNDIQSADAVTAVFDILPKTTQHLSLKDNKINGEAVAALAGVQKTNLRSLDISMNTFNKEELGQLRQAIAGSKLEEIYISVGRATAAELEETLRALPEGVQIHLDLKGAGIDSQEKIEALGRGIVGKTIVSINFLHNLIDMPEKVDALNKVVQQHPELKELDLSSNELDERCINPLKQLVANNRNIEKIELGGRNSIGKETPKEIEDLIKANHRPEFLNTALASGGEAFSPAELAASRQKGSLFNQL